MYSQRICSITSGLTVRSSKIKVALEKVLFTTSHVCVMVDSCRISRLDSGPILVLDRQQSFNPYQGQRRNKVTIEIVKSRHVVSEESVPSRTVQTSPGRRANARIHWNLHYPNDYVLNEHFPSINCLLGQDRFPWRNSMPPFRDPSVEGTEPGHLMTS